MLIFVPHHVTFFLDHNYSTSRRRRGRREARCSLGTEKQSSDLKAIQLEQGVSPYDPTRRDCNTHHPTIRAFTSLYHSAQIINPVVVLTNDQAVRIYGSRHRMTGIPPLHCPSGTAGVVAYVSLIRPASSAAPSLNHPVSGNRVRRDPYWLDRRVV